MSSPLRQCTETPSPFPVSVNWRQPAWHRVLAYYFSIQTNDDRLAAHLQRLLGMFAVDRDRSEEPSPPTPGIPVRYRLADLGDEEDPRFRLYHNDTVLAASNAGGYVLDQLFWHINAECARHSGDYVLIHSGAVASEQGQGVLIPGGSGTGKSTMVAALASRGFTYYSDEAAAIDPVQRLLHPYAKAITLKDRTVFDEYADIQSVETPAGYVRNRWYVIPEQRAGSVPAPCRVGYIILSHFSAGTATNVRPISSAEAAAALGRNIINIGRYGARVLPLLDDIVRGGECFSIESGSLREAVDAVTEATGM